MRWVLVAFLFAAAGHAQDPTAQTIRPPGKNATAAPPTYLEGTANPLSCDLAGATRTTGGAGGSSGAFSNDGTTAQLGRVLDTDTGAGTHWTPEAVLVKPGAGGPTQVGTSADP